MRLQRLSLTRFRCHHSTILETDSRERVLVRGPNGSGKTSILESLHLLASGIGIRTRRDVEFAMFGGEGWRIAVATSAGPALSLKWTADAGRAASIDDVTLSSSGQLIGRLRMTLLRPEDIRIVEGGPSDRRQFLDVMLCQRDAAYLAALRRWRRARKQATAAAMGGLGSPGLRSIKPFLEAEAEVYPVIASARARACSELEAGINARLGTLGVPGHIGLTYRPALPKDATGPASSSDWIEAGRCVARESERVLALGQPSPFGPGRDELRFTLDGTPLRVYGSQGQKRLASLLLRLTEAALLSTSTSPALVLVDDVTGELDADRLTAFLGLLDALPGQVWVAATGTKIYEDRWQNWVRFDIKGGALQGAETR